MPRLETTARFSCPKCKCYLFIPVVVPEVNSSTDHTADNTAEGQTEINCPKCSAIFVAEYFNSMGDCEIRLIDFPNTSVDCEPPSYIPDEDEEDWVNWDTPDDPKSIFMDSYYHTGDLLTEHGGKDGAHLVNRMIFAQQVSALEAYLSDTLVNLVANSEEAMKRLLKSDRDLANKKFTLSEISSDSTLVKTEVLLHLKKIVYHNIPRVHQLYITAAAIDIYELLGSAKNDLLKAIELRHDCVHRNGRNEAGVLLDVFTKKYVREVADMMRRLVDKIEANIQTKLYPPFEEFKVGLNDDIPW